MPTLQTPEAGTMVVAALLIEAIVFAGLWISAYAGNTHPPWDLLPWFGAAAAVIVVVGLVLATRRRRGDGRG